MYGPLLTQAPEGFVLYYQWPEYDLESDAPPFMRPYSTGKDPKGLNRGIWPIVIEEYVSDKEPVLADSDPGGTARNRIVVWQRVFKQDASADWKLFFIKDKRLEGFAIVDGKDYTARWSESARRYLRKWKKEYEHTAYQIEPATLEVFLAGYAQGSVRKDIRAMYTSTLERKVARGANVDLWIVRHLSSGDIAAGMAFINSPSCKGSYYLCGFVSPSHEHVPAMIGLIDAWYQRAHAQGIRFLHFGRFWQKGDPKDWKGFSQFKAKFGLRYIAFPPALSRFMPGKFF